MHIHVTTVVKNRAWVLPYFLGCLGQLDWPAEDLSFYFLDDMSTDGTGALLRGFQTAYAERFRAIVVEESGEQLDDATSARDTTDRPRGYPHLAALRNRALQSARDSDADYWLTIDSDILVVPSILRGLVDGHKNYLGSFIFNDSMGAIGIPIKGRIPNTGFIDQTGNLRPFKTYEFGNIYPCGYTGAVALANREAIHSGAEFAQHKFGEDMPFCLQLQERGFPCHWDSTLRAVHVMESRLLPECLGVYLAWFGRVPPRFEIPPVIPIPPAIPAVDIPADGPEMAAQPTPSVKDVSDDQHDAA